MAECGNYTSTSMNDAWAWKTFVIEDPKPKGWQPVETYDEDRDGSDVMLWNGRSVFPGWLNDDGWHAVGAYSYADEPVHIQPTHWRPYPKPPKQGSPTR